MKWKSESHIETYSNLIEFLIILNLYEMDFLLKLTEDVVPRYNGVTTALQQRQTKAIMSIQKANLNCNWFISLYTRLSCLAHKTWEIFFGALPLLFIPLYASQKFFHLLLLMNNVITILKEIALSCLINFSTFMYQSICC